MRTFKFSLSVFIIYNIQIMGCIAQTESNNKLEKTSEKIVKYNFEHEIIKGRNYIKPIGYIDDFLLYKYRDKNKNIKFFKFNEENKIFKQVFSNLNLSSRFLYQFSSKDSFIFYKKIFFNETDDYGYSNLIVQYDKTQYIIDSIYNADKKIHSSFSVDGNFLIVNTLNTLSDYYNPEQDDRIGIYSLDSLKKGKVSKNYISCTNCADSYLVLS